jgi:RHH-type rel operon transcriptional repressor/antitoxin RelB
MMLGVRLDPDTERGLQQIARRSRRSKSDIAREAIERYVRQHDAALVAEARRQSLRAAARGWSEEDEAWESAAAADEAGRSG